METTQVQLSSNKENLDWDPSESTVTAWSKATSKRRRVYGQKGPNKTTTASSRRQNSDVIDPFLDSVADNGADNLEPPSPTALSNKSLVVIQPTPSKNVLLKCSPSAAVSDNNSTRGRSSSLHLSSSLVDLAWEGAKDGRGRFFSMSETDLMLVHSASPMVKASSAACFSTAASTFTMLANKSQSSMDWMKLSTATSNSSGSSDLDMFKSSSDLLSDFSSPAKSTGSSRKRGVSSTPGFDDLDDVTSIGGFSGRSRSRSRLLSPSPSKKKAFLELSPHPHLDTDHLSCRNERVDPDGSDEESEAEESRHSSESVSSDDVDADDDDSDDYSFMKKKGAFPSSATRRFSGGIFGSSSAVNKPLDHNQVFESMSSYEDLKFLIKALRRERDAKHIMFGFINSSWSVVPPISWPHSRRVAFRHWITEFLGFSVRVGGGAIVFFQIATSKGTDLLQTLEKALISYKATTLKQSEPALVEVKAVNARDKGASFVNDERDKDANASTSFAYGQWNEPHVITQGDDDGWDIEKDLIRSIKTLDISRPPIQSRATLLRHVTLDQNESHVVNPEAFMTDETKRARHSSEHVATNDFMLHMHGFTPARTMSRPPRMSSSSVSSAFAGRMMEASPFMQVLTGGRTSHGCSTSVDFVETPLMKQCQGWGSRPVTNRDWGASDECFGSIMQKLLDRVDDAEERDGVPRSISPRGETISVVSANLGFEFEAGDTQGIPLMERNLDRFDSFAASLTPQVLPPKLERRGSVGASAFAGLTLGAAIDDQKQIRRRLISFAKHKRISVCAAILNPFGIQEPKHVPVCFGVSRLEQAEEENGLLHSRKSQFPVADGETLNEQSHTINDPKQAVLLTELTLMSIFKYFEERELIQNISAVSKKWADVATKAHANLMLASVGCTPYFATSPKAPCVGNEDDECLDDSPAVSTSKIVCNQRDWNFLVSRFPWACFLGDGAFKRVYKVWNASMECYEALSLMDIDAIESTGGLSVLGAELAVSAMVTSLVRRAICPNFIAMRGIFTCPYEPPGNQWGCVDDKKPRGSIYDKSVQVRKPRVPAAKSRGHFQYIRMELCQEGDVEEYLKRQPDEAVSPSDAQMILFQVAFALHAAAVQIHMKHYDVKLLNVFLKSIPTKKATAKHVVLRYGMGSNTYALRMEANHALVAKLADYGTANVDPSSNGCSITMAQFTTLENSPPEFMYLGDAATQGHGHDAFSLGLCMLHLFTGHAPYEEILCDVKCPPCLRKKLGKIWEDGNSEGYSVLRDIILSNVYKDENGNVVEGEPDDTMYNTFYRFLVLFGIPTKVPMRKECGRVWRAVDESLDGCKGQKRYENGRAPKIPRDADLFAKHRAKFSLSHGTNKYIMRARKSLQSMPGGMELLMSLVSFDPVCRATALDVLNSQFMEPLREDPRMATYSPSDDVRSYTAFSTH